MFAFKENGDIYFNNNLNDGLRYWGMIGNVLYIYNNNREIHFYYPGMSVDIFGKWHLIAFDRLH